MRQEHNAHDSRRSWLLRIAWASSHTQDDNDMSKLLTPEEQKWADATNDNTKAWLVPSLRTAATRVAELRAQAERGAGLTERQHLWAIAARSEIDGFIGRFWAEDGYPRWPSSVPVQPRLFQTRAEARDFLKKMKGNPWVAYPSAQVVRVIVTVEVVED